MPIYQEYALVYDRAGQMGFSKRMLHYVDQLLELHPPAGNRLLDLACGTGTFAIGMAQKGWEAQGVDGSAAMLQQAKAKPFSNLVQWSRQDMRMFSPLIAVDLVTCLYDSLNYMLTDEDLVSVFKRVYAALGPQGLFIFDMNTARVMANHWDDVTDVIDNDEFTVIMHTTYDAHRQRACAFVTCFERQGEYYVKSQEEHIEQAYPLAQVSNNLTLVGMQVEAAYACFTQRPAREDDERIIWVARKGAIDAPLYL